MEEDTKTVHPAVALVLARMDSHPHEFRKYRQDHKPGNNILNPVFSVWAELLPRTKDSFMTSHERALYERKLREIRMEEAHERIMRHLLK